METQSFAWSPLQVFSKSGQKVYKNKYPYYLTLSNSAWIILIFPKYLGLIFSFTQKA